MEAFVSRKRRRLSPTVGPSLRTPDDVEDAESTTDFKIALLASLRPDCSQDVLLDYLLAYNGSVERASEVLTTPATRTISPKKVLAAANGYQSSLSSFARIDAAPDQNVTSRSSKLLSKKGKTLHLYSPEDVEAHTPCSIVHNFLPRDEAEALTKELLAEAPSFQTETFQLFDRTVQSPHTMRFYVDSYDDAEAQKTQYVYNGSLVADVGHTPPVMLRVAQVVKTKVNEEIERRIANFHPNGEKLKFQSPDEWNPNTSFVNCYDGGKQSVGYHADQLTYLGPRAIIGSLSLGVAREFRVRRVVPSEDVGSADAQGQIAIHLPHNSLLVMHAEMQEEWKHSISPAQAIDPHPLAGNKRLNVTYRCYKDYLHPKYTPRCKCHIPAVLRCVQKRAATQGRYMWMCHSNYTPGQKGCSYFVWADFDVDGRPPWAEGYKWNANLAPSEKDV